MEDALQILSKTISDAKAAKTSLNDAVVAKKSVFEAISNVRKAITNIRKTQPDLDYAVALESTLSEAPSILADEIKDAVTKAPEYAYIAFLGPLLDVAKNKDLYKVTAVGTGWNRSITVSLAMNEVAGSIDDYAEAVQGARATLGVKDSDSRDAVKASDFWRKKGYPHKDGIYAKTINLRLAISASPAPFWSLLNDGSKNVSMSSSIGGTPFPSRGGHHFVQNTEEKIRRLFVSTFRKLKERSIGVENGLYASIEDANIILDKLQREIDRMSADSDLLLNIASEIGVTVGQLNASKVLVAASRIKSGDMFTTRVVVGDGIRIRTRKFIALLSGYD